MLPGPSLLPFTTLWAKIIYLPHTSIWWISERIVVNQWGVSGSRNLRLGTRNACTSLELISPRSNNRCHKFNNTLVPTFTKRMIDIFSIWNYRSVSSNGGFNLEIVMSLFLFKRKILYLYLEMSTGWKEWESFWLLGYVWSLLDSAGLSCHSAAIATVFLCSGLSSLCYSIVLLLLCFSTNCNTLMIFPFAFY